MKTRLGFVSNSSSSSFIIACKEELCSCTLKKAMKIDHPLGFVVEAVASFIEMNVQRVDLREWEHRTAHQAPDIMKELCERFEHVYTFEADTTDGGTEVSRMLYNNAKNFHVKTKDLVIECLQEND